MTSANITVEPAAKTVFEQAMAAGKLRGWKRKNAESMRILEENERRQAAAEVSSDR